MVPRSRYGMNVADVPASCSYGSVVDPASFNLGHNVNMTKKSQNAALIVVGELNN